MKRALLVGAGTILCAGACSRTLPVAAIMSNGQTFRGTQTAEPSGGHFSVSADNVTCVGDWNPWEQSDTIAVPVLCSDGRKGILTVTRTESRRSGGGRIRLSDGTEGDFIF